MLKARYAAFVCLVLLAASSLRHFTVRAEEFFYVTSLHSVLQYSSTGIASGSLTGGTLNSASGIAVDASGNFYVADGSGPAAIHKFSAAGSYVGIFSTNSLRGPQGVAVDAGGNVFVANLSGGNVLKFAPDGSLQTTYATGGFPFSLAIDGSGNLYVGDPALNLIKQISTAGNITTFIGTGSGPTALVQPQGLTFDASGNLYVANYGSSNILKFSADGVQRSVFASTGLDRPIGLDFDTAGNLYVVNNASFTPAGAHPLAGTVRKFSSTGTDLGTFITSDVAIQSIVIRSSTVVAQPPRLAASLVTGGVQLSWPTNAAGYALETKTALGQGTWLTVNSTPAVQGDRFAVTNATSGPAAYFRLRK